MNYKLRNFILSGDIERPLEEISLIKVGDIVKLVFELDEPKSDKEGNVVHAERMWVQVVSVSGEVLKGELDNDPIYLNKIQAGDEITFSKENVFDIWKD